MLLTNIEKATSWFQVLESTELSQTALMTLPPGESSGPKAEAHEQSDQVLLLLEGELTGEIADELVRFRKGDTITIPAGTKHKFTNEGRVPAITFNVYAPPVYPPGTRE